MEENSKISIRFYTGREVRAVDAYSTKQWNHNISFLFF